MLLLVLRRAGRLDFGPELGKFVFVIGPAVDCAGCLLVEKPYLRLQVGYLLLGLEEGGLRILQRRKADVKAALGAALRCRQCQIGCDCHGGHGAGHGFLSSLRATSTSRWGKHHTTPATRHSVCLGCVVDGMKLDLVGRPVGFLSLSSSCGRFAVPLAGLRRPRRLRNSGAGCLGIPFYLVTSLQINAHCFAPTIGTRRAKNKSPATTARA